MIKERQHYAGDYLEIDFLPFRNVLSRRGRKRKAKPTSEAQAHINQLNRERELYMLIHENFTRNDYAIHPTYSPGFYPSDAETALKDRRNFILRLKRLYKRFGISEFKYVAVLEQGSSTGRYHHHMIISGGVPRELVEECWGMGTCNCDRLQFSEQGVIGLSKYIVKSADSSENNELKKCTFKAFSCSRNLKRPKLPKEKIVSKKVFNNLWDDFENRRIFEDRYKDYFFVEAVRKDNIEFGERYMTVRMCKKTAKLDYIYDLKYNGGIYVNKASRRARQVKKIPPD